jgi:hypothetical protein
MRLQQWAANGWLRPHQTNKRQACQEAGTPAPVIDYKPNDLWIEFPFAPEYLKAIATTSQSEAQSGRLVTGEVTGEVSRMLLVLTAERSRKELQELLDLKHDEHFRLAYLQPALAAGLIERTLPDKPNSRLQKYRITPKGRAYL